MTDISGANANLHPFEKKEWLECVADQAKRIVELEDALRRVVRDVNDYEEANKLSPNPGRAECWDSVAHAKAVLAAA